MWEYSTCPREIGMGLCCCWFFLFIFLNKMWKDWEKGNIVEIQYLYRKNSSHFTGFTEILKCFIVFIMLHILCDTLLVMYTEVGLSIIQTQVHLQWPWTVWSWSKGLMSLRGWMSLLLQGMLKLWVKKVFNLDISVSCLIVDGRNLGYNVCLMYFALSPCIAQWEEWLASIAKHKNWEEWSRHATLK